MSSCTIKSTEIVRKAMKLDMYQSPAKYFHMIVAIKQKIGPDQ